MANSDEGVPEIDTLRRDRPGYPNVEKCLAVLKQIKHALIGHEQMKQVYVEKGLISILVDNLRLDNPSKEMRLEAALCIGSLAYGGEMYADLLLREGALAGLIAALDISTSPEKLVLTSLRTLNTLFDTCPLGTVATTHSIAGEITHEIYSNRNTLRYIEKILAQTSPSTVVQQQISLAATLVSKTCSHGGSGEMATMHMERHQKLLISHGILDVLGRRLAGFIVREPGTGSGYGGSMNLTKSGLRYQKAHDDEDKENSQPPPAPMAAKLAPILDAIAVIIKNNSYRAYQFLYAPWILSVFPVQSSTKVAKTTHSSVSAASGTQPRNVPQQLPSPTLLTASAFPPLSAAAAHFFQGRGGYADSGSDVMGDADSAANTPAPGSDAEDTPRRNKRKRLDNTVFEESPLVKWLITIVRTSDPLTKLMATSLLTNLCQTRLTGPIVKSIEHMVLPLLVRLLDEDTASTTTKPVDNRKTDSLIGGYAVPQHVEWIIRKRAPAVLADLVNNDAQMQKAAVEGNAIKRLAGMLKRTFEVAKKKKPEKSSGLAGRKDNYYDDDSEDENSKSASTVNTPDKINRMKVRESTLRCIAGITSLKDDYRKLMIDTGIVPYVVACLEQTAAPRPQQPGAENKADPLAVLGVIREANPPRVLIAAAYVIRSFSRSVHILRTNLVDAKVATPLMELLKNPNVEVKNAATMALCNLVLDFSPMRQPILDMGALDILCEQAHSSNVELQLNSVWALKHLVYSADNEVKATALKKLGSGWLADLIDWDDALAVGARELGTDDEEEEEEEEDAEDEGGGEDEDDVMGHDELGYNPVDAMNAEYTGRNHAGGESSEEEGGPDQMKDSIGQLSRPSQSSQNLGEQYSSHEGFSPSGTRQHRGRTNSSEGYSQRSSMSPFGRCIPPYSNRALRHARQQWISVQEQGFNFIRNLICGNDTAEILDLLFTGVGKERVFSILERKLKPKCGTQMGDEGAESATPVGGSSTVGGGGGGGGGGTLSSSTAATAATSRRPTTASSSESATTAHQISGANTTSTATATITTNPSSRLPSTEILVPVIFILVHIAANHARHRQTLIEQTEVLKALLPLFAHESTDVRVGLAWVVINLTWKDDSADEAACKARAVELRRLGFVKMMEGLLEDRELDVRERAKAGLYQIKQCLEG